MPLRAAGSEVSVGGAGAATVCVGGGVVGSGVATAVGVAVGLHALAISPRHKTRKTLNGWTRFTEFFLLQKWPRMNTNFTNQKLKNFTNQRLKLLAPE